MPFVVLVAHACLYGDWIVDDAGISFAYARNLAEGHGLVAQVGASPVEGFTNLLWTVLLAVVIGGGVFDPVWTPKVLGVLAAAGAFALLRRAAVASDARRGPWVDGALALVACTPGFVAWSVSGLENGLLVLLVAAAAGHAVRSLRSGAAERRAALAAAGLAFLCATVRPDALVFAVIWPGSVLLARPGSARERTRALAVFAAALAAGVALLTAWRLSYFGDPVPNTFYAKVSADRLRLLRVALACALPALALGVLLLRRRLSARVLGAGAALAFFGLLYASGADRVTRGVAGGAGTALLAIAAAHATVRGRDPRDAPLWLAVFASLLAFLALPRDWMAEYRFGTAFLLTAPLVIALDVGAPGRRLLETVAPRRGRLVATVALALATAGLLAMHVRRALRFRSAPTVPMATVQARFQSTFVKWVDELGLPGATVLTPDVGGPLWSRKLRIEDLGGLCDQTIARALRRDPQKLCDYVFEELRPTFIAFHDTWGGQTGLPFDPRLLERYFAIHTATYRDDEGASFPVGTFVAKEAVPDAERARQLGAR